MDYSKAIDKMQVSQVVEVEIDGQTIAIERLEDGTFRKPAYLAGQVREVVGRIDTRAMYDGNDRTEIHRYTGNAYNNGVEGGSTVRNITAPATDAARTWAGYGSALKPSVEPILCFRKPRTSTYAATAQEHGTGCLNVDGTRIGTNSTPRKDPHNGNMTNALVEVRPWMKRRIENGEPLKGDFDGNQGRWPANCIFDEIAAAVLDEMSGELTSGGGNKSRRSDTAHTAVFGNYNAPLPDVREIDTGGASRFFKVLPSFIYEAKSPQAERSAGLNGNARQRDASRNAEQPSMNGGEGNPYNRGAQEVRNFHPTVKPVALTEYLARLIVPPKEYRADARILIPFSGSGSEMIGALIAGWLNVDGIELMEEYVAIARQRLEHWQDEISMEPRKMSGGVEDYAAMPQKEGTPSLFAMT
jgi:hypothetical protein